MKGIYKKIGLLVREAIQDGDGHEQASDGHGQEKNKGLALAAVLTILQVEVVGEMMDVVADKQVHKVCRGEELIGPSFFKPKLFRNQEEDVDNNLHS